MMPELGKYAAEVISAYVVTLGLLGLLVAVSLRQSVRTRHALKQVEEDRQAKLDVRSKEATADGQ